MKHRLRDRLIATVLAASVLTFGASAIAGIFDHCFSCFFWCNGTCECHAPGGRHHKTPPLWW